MTIEDDGDIRNILRRGAKLPYPVMLKLVESFVGAMPISEAAIRAGVSSKTAKGYYVLLRDKLMSPAFARWHPRNIQYLLQEGKDAEELRWQAMLPKLARCYSNRSCLDNYRRGKREDRVCRNCPLRIIYDDNTYIDQLVFIADSSREFYAGMGWGAESTIEPAHLLELRITHESILMLAEEHSRRDEHGDIILKEDDGRMSLGEVFRVFLVTLSK